MTSHTRRYLAGDHETVWADLRRLGNVPDALRADCAAVAAETMRRAGRHAKRLAEQLAGLGFEPSAQFLSPPTEADRAELDVLGGEIGGVPAALDACLRYVGGVWFAGDCAALGLAYHSGDPYGGAGGVLPDPLVLPGVSYLRYGWDEYREAVADGPEPADDGFVFDFAPDELHKANISGGTHDIALPSAVADPVLDGVGGRPGVTLVEYLRLSVAWGGMPGWSFRPESAPAALSGLRAVPDF